MDCEKCGKPLEQCICEKAPADQLGTLVQRVKDNHSSLSDKISILEESIKKKKKKDPAKTKLENEQAGLSLDDIRAELEELKSRVNSPESEPVRETPREKTFWQKFWSWEV